MKTMKKTYFLLLLTMISFTGLLAQPLSLSWDGEPIGDNLVLIGSSSDSEIIAHLVVTNNTSSDMDIKLRRTDIEVGTGTMNYFCWAGNCFPPHIDESTSHLTLGPGESSSDIEFSGHLMPNGFFGDSYVEYKFFNMNDASEFVKVETQFASTGVGVEDKSIEFNVYPNPASDNVTIITKYNMVSVSILNSLGQLISHENVGDDKYQMNTSNLDKGMYFIKLLSDGEMITKQLIIK